MNYRRVALVTKKVVVKEVQYFDIDNDIIDELTCNDSIDELNNLENIWDFNTICKTVEIVEELDEGDNSIIEGFVQVADIDGLSETEIIEVCKKLNSDDLNNLFEWYDFTFDENESTSRNIRDFAETITEQFEMDD